jgi:hypothetical protein
MQLCKVSPLVFATALYASIVCRSPCRSLFLFLHALYESNYVGSVMRI